jgi:creatinine amidohydrolase/Fe(II)-dependent formamide hydrolase-like protein
LDQSGIIDAVARIPGHAGTFETALMLASHPDFVEAALVPDKLPAPKNARPVVGPTIFGSRTNYGYGPGYSDDPKAATAELGHKIRQACVQGLAEFFVKLHGMTVKE